MATKRLRSLILEVLPLDLRVKLDLLSRRRDISNREKQAELFNILREFKIDNVTKLGSGTNRYAFRLNGYVVKVATDNDGKIDNFKEFKMAKRLYPNVIKIYEVSSNGTLQICEYIQPFQSFSEMMMYADKIRNILQKLSSVYLIGDVGLSSRNYANWGLRVGSDEPVCLDFAYVYEVKSELFLCTHCKSGSVLIPNKDFTELICPNPGCGHKFLFEDIRRKLGNDLHKQEIGDLTEEGYLLSESKVETTLDPQRSNYLEGKRKKKKKEIVEEVEEDEDFTDDFVYDDKEELIMKKTNVIEAIAQSMSEETFNVNGTTLKGVNVIDVTSADDDDDIVVADDDDYDDYDDEDEDDYDDDYGDYAYDDDDDEDEDNKEEDDDFVIPDTENNGLAFSGEVEVIDDGQIDISDEDTSGDEPEFVFELTDEEAGVEAEAEPEAEPVQEWDVVTNPSEDDWDVAKACQENFDKMKEESDKRVEAFRKEQEAKLAEAQAVAAKVEAMVADVKAAVEAKPVEVETEPVEETKEEVAETANTGNHQNISPVFMEQINRALSKFSNQIADFAYNDEVFDKIRNSLINKKFFAGDFKNLISSVLFRSLCIFLECKEEVIPNSNNKGTHKEWRLSKDDISNEPYYPTALFISRYWFNREMNNATTMEDLMYAYSRQFKCDEALQEEFIDGIFRSRLKQKLAASTAAYDLICTYIKSLTIQTGSDEETSDELIEVVTDPAEEAADDLIEAVGDTAEDVSLTVDEIVNTVMNDIEAEKEAEPIEKPVEEVTTQEGEEATISSEEDETDDEPAEDVSIDDMVNAAFDLKPAYDDAVNEDDDSTDDEEVDEDGEETDEMYDEDYDEDASSISVIVYNDEYGDVIKVKTEDEYGSNTLPIYTNINTYKSIKDGMFNWLKNLVPFIVFKTSEPEKYEGFNDVISESESEDLVKFVPIGTSGNETIIGVYDFLGFYSVDDDGNMSPITDKTFIGKICAALNLKFPVASSYRERTLAMKDLWADESELLEYIRDQFNIDIDEDDVDDEEEDVVDTAAEEEEHKVFTPIRRGDM